MKNIDAGLDESLIRGIGLTSKIYYTENGEEKELLRLHGTEDRIWVSGNNIGDNLKKAFISVEDHRFYEHSGIDVRRTAGAVLNFFGGKNYGGSTITQQLIKNLTGENKVTVKRKLTEIMRALEIEKTLSKSDILELYLNNVYLSSGCFGVETAAEKYFGKSAAELSIAEAATLAGIVQNPSAYDPIKKSENCKKRRDTVLFRMHELGAIDDIEYENALAEELLTVENSKSEKEEIYSWFVDALIEDVISDLVARRGISREAASQKVYSGGLAIHSTLDKDIQSLIDDFYADSSNFPKNDVGTPDSAAVIINGKTGAVLAVSGGRGRKNANRTFSLATSAKRSPGSSLKPISVYAPAIEKDLVTWATVFDDVPLTFTKTGNDYTAWPKNNPRIYSGLTTVKRAVENSVNTVAVNVLRKVGVENSFAFCKKAGLSTLEERFLSGGRILSDVAEAPLALGATSVGVSVRDITGAYTMFTRGGEFEKPYTYTAVYDSDGTLLLENGKSAERLISEDTADIMRRLLKTVVTSGTAKGLTLPYTVEVAGKTGTSNSNADRWFIGMTPELVCGVWYGYRDGRDIGEYKENPAAVVFDRLMGKVYENMENYEKRFPTSENVISAAYCVDSGLAPSGACALDLRGHRIETGYFKKGTAPKSACDTHIKVLYDKKTHAVACDKCPKENLSYIGLLKLPPRSFPINVKVTDSQYTYLYLPIGTEPSLAYNEPFFAFLAKQNEYFGTSGVEKAKNRYCREHYEEQTTESTTVPQTTAPQIDITDSTSPPHTTAATQSPSTSAPQTTSAEPSKPLPNPWAR